MMYADTDFFLAIIKKEDWLKSGAKKIYEKHKGNICTSMLTLVELALISKRKELDIETIVGSVFDIADVEGIAIEEAMKAAHLIKDEGAGVFDSFHLVMSRDKPIVSSEHVYDRFKKERIKLEK